MQDAAWNSSIAHAHQVSYFLNMITQSVSRSVFWRVLLFQHFIGVLIQSEKLQDCAGSYVP